MRDAVHSLVPNLRVSPLALPPPALRFEGVVSMDDCEDVTEKRLSIFDYLYDTREERDAGSTLALLQETFPSDPRREIRGG